MEKLVPDTSVIIEGLVSQKIEEQEFLPETIIIHEAVISELEHQANLDKAIGYLGLEEIRKIRHVADKHDIKIEFKGRKPTAGEIKYANLGEIDALIRDLAFEEGATLFTADKIQAKIAEAKGMDFIFFKVEQLHKRLKLEEYFDETTMSVHLRENVLPYAKKGTPGNWQFTAVGNKELDRDLIQEISTEIIEEAGIRKDGFIEIERPGSTIVQLGPYRIVITKPPFSDGWEITAVRPVKKLSMEDYQLSEKLRSRIEQQAEGILIAGAPGMGKSTMAQALAEHYASLGKIVKTVEAPRDLILPDNITQYAISHGDAQEIHDILLLSRPDYTIFDEMRNTADFKLFADLRLSGIGLAGVVHATNPIDAIQRFVGRIELGVIPQVIDTVIFINKGAIGKVLSLEMTVKVPTGMTEADLARPVVVVTDFETGKIEYELYSYGEETVVIPVKAAHASLTPSRQLASRAIEDVFRKMVRDTKVEVVSDHKCIVYVPEEDISRIIGKQGKTIGEIEKSIGMSIDIRALEDAPRQPGEKGSQPVKFNMQQSNKSMEFSLGHNMQGKDIHVYVGGEYLLTVKAGSSGTVKIKKKNKIGNMLAGALKRGEQVELRV
ncbi:Flp pilus assembly complex ATPase component TadA [Candidatus Woesearchaeota archaeon]|nr:Flp pilus assembly complex ATPase component TadA [Candidatus Woesearchaeota archaeon]